MRRLVLGCVAVMGLMVRPLPAQQDAAQVEALALLLRAQDIRLFDPAMLRGYASSPDPLVRRTVATTIGRIGNRNGTPLLLPLLQDPDAGVVTETMFAYGLLKDSTAVEPILARLASTDSLSADAIGEAAATLVRIGSDAAVAYVEATMKGTSLLRGARRMAFLPNAVQDAWRLGSRMPAAAMLPFLTDTSVDLRWRTFYALGRTRSLLAAPALMRALRDRNGTIRELAAKAITKRFADTAAIPLNTAQSELQRLLDDEAAGVRIAALASLVTFADSTLTARFVPLLSDPVHNVRVAAAQALGDLRTTTANAALVVALEKKDAIWAVKRTALSLLARNDTVRFIAHADAWMRSPDLRDRLTAIAGWGSVRNTDNKVFQLAMTATDAREKAAALRAWRASRGARDSLLLEVARPLLTNANSDLRAAALGVLQGSLSINDLDALVGAWKLALTEGDPDNRLAVFRALLALSRNTPDLITKLEDPARRAVLARPSDMLVRRLADSAWPALSARWGAVYPVESARTLPDYRSLVRTYMLARTNPTVTIEVEGKGIVTVDLLAREAPLTVANFLRLVDQHYFDGIQWHRVVPNFVVQAGDPTGTGSGGPGWSIRDEINRRRYALPTLGMALSGPDTGGSQWFITLAPQPHLDYGYTIFGQVTGSQGPLYRIVQGDVIRTIRR